MIRIFEFIPHKLDSTVFFLLYQSLCRFYNFCFRMADEEHSRSAASDEDEEFDVNDDGYDDEGKLLTLL